MMAKTPHMEKPPVCLSCVVNVSRGSDASEGVAYTLSQRQCCGLTEDWHRVVIIIMSVSLLVEVVIY